MMSGMLMVAGFILLAALMATDRLPVLLALPVMAVWMTLVSGSSLDVLLNTVVLGGSLKLGAAMLIVVFGAMFAQVMGKTGVSAAIVRQVAELSGDKPFSLALLMFFAVAFVFVGMSGLGAVIMVGSIALPLLMGSGIAAAHAVCIVLLAIQSGLLMNMASYGPFIGVFGAEAAMSYIVPAAVISLAFSLLFMVRKVLGTDVAEGLKAVGPALGLLFKLPCAMLAGTGGGRSKENGLILHRQAVPAPAFLAPLLPLLTVFICGSVFGTNVKTGGINPIAAGILGFVLASVYAILLTRPQRLSNLLAGALVDGIKDVAGVIFLFFGIGMVVAAVMLPEAKAALAPVLQALLPHNPLLVLLVFALLAPAALYRGPLNMFGMGAGLASILVGLNVLPLQVACGVFLATGYVQAICDPTNSHNTWLAGFAGVETSDLLRLLLPYAWGMGLTLLLYVACFVM